MTEASNQSSNIIESIIDQSLHAINKVDAQAAAQRVATLQAEQPTATPAELAEQLIKRKALQAGMVGAVTSGAAIVPGLGTLAAFSLGVATDVGVTMRIQSELALELAALYGQALNADERRKAIMVVTGVNLGAEQVVSKSSKKLAEKAAERFAGRAFVKVIPFVGIAASAGANILTTYAVGQRAQAYFSLGDAAGHDVAQSMRAITGVDERKLVDLLTDVMTHVGQSLGTGAQRLGEAGQRASTALGDGARQMGARARRRIVRRNRGDQGHAAATNGA